MNDLRRVLGPSLALVASLALGAVSCAGDDGGGGGEGVDTESQSSRRDDCLRLLAATCDYLDDCYNFEGFDEDECLQEAEVTCDDVVDSSPDQVDRCVEELGAVECDASVPRACNDAVTFPDDDEDDGSGGAGGGVDGSGGGAGGDATCEYDEECPEVACDDGTVGQLCADGECVMDATEVCFDEGGACSEDGEPCSTTACCGVSVCVEDIDTSDTFCASPCTADADCASGCCEPDLEVCLPVDYCG